MRILAIGGTIFVGRHFVEAALANGHDVTLFHRGQRGAELFPTVKRVLGDREHDLGKAEGEWDAVVDFCGYLPRMVGISADEFKGRTKSYVFISTISVYGEPTTPPDEDHPMAQIEDPTTEEITGETYGALKALCEEELLRRFPKNSLIVRPGIIVGPNDPTDRFTYWTVALSSYDRVVVPDRLEQPVQWIDARDLAAWLLSQVEAGETGVFNAVGPSSRCTLGEFIEGISRAVGGKAEVVSLPGGRLEEMGVKPWADLPLVPSYTTEGDPMFEVSSARAIGKGLRFRSLAESARDTLAWRKPSDAPLKVGIPPERIAEIG